MDAGMFRKLDPRIFGDPQAAGLDMVSYLRKGIDTPIPKRIVDAGPDSANPLK